MNAKTASNTTSLAVVGVDIGNDVFHLVGLGADRLFAERSGDWLSKRRSSSCPAVSLAWKLA